LHGREIFLKGIFWGKISDGKNLCGPLRILGATLRNCEKSIQIQLRKGPRRTRKGPQRKIKKVITRFTGSA
jgi:hypothetical protein